MTNPNLQVSEHFVQSITTFREEIELSLNKWQLTSLFLQRFSPCSLRAIRAVLVAKSSRCFTEPEESYCGNQRVEGQEECDAGLVGQDDIDLCCDKNCKLRNGAMCSDRNSPCCQGCQYMNHGVKCREKQPSTCENESRCLGTKAECPKAKPMDDGTPCIEKGQCFQGTCLPYCETQDKQSCMCDISKSSSCCWEITRIRIFIIG